MKTFLEGQSGVGKTSLIYEICTALNLNAAGFVSVKLYNADGESTGFCIDNYKNYTLNYENQKPKNDDFTFIKGLPGERKIYLSAFSNYLKTIDINESFDIFIMDEIGGIELLVPEFKNYMKSLLEKDILILGTVKSNHNLKYMYKRCSEYISEDIEKIAAEFKGYLNLKSKILTITEDNKEDIKAKIINDITKKLK